MYNCQHTQLIRLLLNLLHYHIDIFPYKIFHRLLLFLLHAGRNKSFMIINLWNHLQCINDFYGSGVKGLFSILNTNCMTINMLYCMYTLILFYNILWLYYIANQYRVSYIHCNKYTFLIYMQSKNRINHSMICQLM